MPVACVPRAGNRPRTGVGHDTSSRPGSQRQSGILIAVAMTGSDKGYVIATPPGENPYVFPERIVVGDVHRDHPDGGAETWRAWLWPVPGGALHTARSVEGAHARSRGELERKLQKRAGRDAWWTHAEKTDSRRTA